VQNPIREQIKLDGRWQARRIDDQSVSVFVPDSWTDKAIVLREGEGHPLEQPSVGGAALKSDLAEPGWRAEAHVVPGEWNTVSATGDMTGARLEAGNDLHITSLEAVSANQRSLAVRVRLAGSSGEVSAEKTLCLLSLEFTLTAPDGRQVGGMDLVVGNKTRDLSVEMPVPAALGGPHRLKATLCCNDRVVDNARIDLHL
jgi:hypothetical protein